MTEPAPLYNELAEAPESGHAFWLGSGRRRLRAAVWDEGTRGTALIFTGRTEYIEKYGRVISMLVERGFSVAALDWRGQGLSERPLHNRLKGHVGNFAAYQRDVAAFLAAPQVVALPGRRVLFCHSMGGCIGVRALLDERLAPAATVMSAPMLGLAMTPLMRIAALGMVAFARRFGFETSFTPTPKAARPYVLRHDFAGNVLTGDSDHYEWFRKHLEAEPGFALGGPTLGWLAESFDETEALSAAPAPEGPMLVMAGSEEGVVDADAIRRFAAKSTACRLLEIKGAHHEIFFETALIRQRAWTAIDRFLVETGV